MSPGGHGVLRTSPLGAEQVWMVLTETGAFVEGLRSVEFLFCGSRITEGLLCSASLPVRGGTLDLFTVLRRRSGDAREMSF